VPMNKYGSVSGSGSSAASVSDLNGDMEDVRNSGYAAYARAEKNGMPPPPSAWAAMPSSSASSSSAGAMHASDYRATFGERDAYGPPQCSVPGQMREPPHVNGAASSSRYDWSQPASLPSDIPQAHPQTLHGPGVGHAHPHPHPHQRHGHGHGPAHGLPAHNQIPFSSGFSTNGYAGEAGYSSALLGQETEYMYNTQAPYNSAGPVHLGRGVPAVGDQRTSISYAPAPRELQEMGLAGAHSGVNQRWTSFMQDSGLFFGGEM